METIRADKAQRNDRNREGIDLQMKFDETAEGFRKSGVLEGMPDMQAKKIVLAGVATQLGLTIDEITTRLSNKEKVTPAPTQGVDKMDGETAAYLQMEEEVNTAMAEQDKAEDEWRKLTEASEAGRFKAEAARAKASNLRKNQGLAWNRSLAPPAENMETEAADL